MSRDSVVRALRTAGITFLTIFVPGVLGWINGLTTWANSHGQQPFPSASTLGYLGISAIAAAGTGTLNLVLNAIEDASGRGIGRTVASPTARRSVRAATGAEQARRTTRQPTPSGEGPAKHRSARQPAIAPVSGPMPHVGAH